MFFVRKWRIHLSSSYFLVFVISALHHIYCSVSALHHRYCSYFLPCSFFTADTVRKFQCPPVWKPHVLVCMAWKLGGTIFFCVFHLFLHHGLCSKWHIIALLFSISSFIIFFFIDLISCFIHLDLHSDKLVILRVFHLPGSTSVSFRLTSSYFPFQFAHYLLHPHLLLYLSLFWWTCDLLDLHTSNIMCHSFILSYYLCSSCRVHGITLV